MCVVYMLCSQVYGLPLLGQPHQTAFYRDNKLADHGSPKQTCLNLQSKLNKAPPAGCIKLSATIHMQATVTGLSRTSCGRLFQPHLSVLSPRVVYTAPAVFSGAPYRVRRYRRLVQAGEVLYTATSCLRRQFFGKKFLISE